MWYELKRELRSMLPIVAMTLQYAALVAIPLLLIEERPGVLGALAITAGYVFRPMRKGDVLDKTRPDTHMSGNAIWQIVTGYCIIFPNTEVTPHDLRRTAAKLMLEGGAPIEQISLVLGHSDIKTTQRYLGVDLDWDNPATAHTGLRSPFGR